MRELFTFLFVLGSVFYISCNRCYTCKVKDPVGNTIYFAEERCGGKSKLESYKQELAEEHLCQTYTVVDSIGDTLFVSSAVCGDIPLMQATDSALMAEFIADSPMVYTRIIPTRVECEN